MNFKYLYFSRNFFCLSAILFLSLTLNSSLSQIDIFKKRFNGISIFYNDPHHAVLSSLIRGLQKFNIPYTINPSEHELKDVSFCLQGAQLLRKNIEYKKKKKIKKLIVGPNMFGRIIEENYLILHKAIDAYLQPGEWTKIACIQDAPAVKSIIHVWPSGIDPQLWRPDLHLVRNKKALVYWKTEPESFCNKTTELLKHYGWEPIIVKYGSYTPEYYKKILQEVQLAVFISRSESQGIALAECWAMDVPTFNWDPHEVSYMGKQYDPVTSCPYLSDQTGKRWLELAELEELLKKFESYKPQFSPREWVLNNMTDEISVSLLLEIING